MIQAVTRSNRNQWHVAGADDTESMADGLLENEVGVGVGLRQRLGLGFRLRF